MKKSYVMLAAAAVSLFAACQKEDVLIDQTTELQKPIGFGTYSPSMTRAENDKDATDKSQGLEKYHSNFFVWGYKRVDTGSDAYTYTPVFEGNENDGAATPTPKPTATTVTYDEASSEWTYTPIRFWDKAATHYNFYAVTPAIAGWTRIGDVSKDVNDGYDYEQTGTVNNAKFTFTDYVADGLSLAQNEKEPTGIANSIFAVNEDNTKNKDLMISSDILKNKVSHTNNVVTFEFNHILSRLNIAVKSGLTAVFAQKVDATNGPVYKSSETGFTETTFYKEKNGSTGAFDGDYYYLDGTNVEKTGFNPSLLSPVDDETKPLSGYVKLTEVKVFNLKDKGSFDERFTETNKLTADLLAAGTDKRWTPAWNDATNEISQVGVAFDNTATAAVPTVGTDDVVGTPYFTSDGNSDATNIVTDEYNYVYQGLVVPQTINYKECKINGTDVYDATNKKSLKNANPFIKISFTVDGEPFTYFYNLAEVFSNVLSAYKDADGYQYVKTTEDDVYVLVKDNKYYNSSKTEYAAGTVFAFKNKDAKGNDVYTNATGAQIFFDGTDYYETYDETTTPTYSDKLDPQPEVVMLGAYNAPDYLTRKEATTKQLSGASAAIDADECDITFCEGWQNDLKIIIAPAAIKFDACVYEWKTKNVYEFTVE